MDMVEKKIKQWEETEEELSKLVEAIIFLHSKREMFNDEEIKKLDFIIDFLDEKANILYLASMTMEREFKAGVWDDYPTEEE